MFKEIAIFIKDDICKGRDNDALNSMINSLSNLDINKDYEEIDTRLASGWYVDDINIPKKKIYKTKQTSFKISKKLNS